MARRSIKIQTRADQGVGENRCPPGYYWRPALYRNRIFWYGQSYIEEQCVKKNKRVTNSVSREWKLGIPNIFKIRGGNTTSEETEVYENNEDEPKIN